MKNLLITGGTLWNGKQFVRGNALLLSGGLIKAAGREEDVRAAAPSSCPVLCLSGESVLPGITDAHIHLTTWAKQKTLLDLSPAECLPDMLSMVKAEAAKIAPGRWIRDGTTMKSAGPEGGPLHGRDLDSLGIPNPVLLQRVCTHVNAANSRALELSGLESEDGVLLEREAIPALRAMERDVFSRSAVREALRKGLIELASHGITCVHPSRCR